MTEIVTYRCDICHIGYSNEELAIECEKSHKRPDRIVGCEEYVTGKYEGYPRYIWVGAGKERAKYKFNKVEGGNEWV